MAKVSDFQFDVENHIDGKYSWKRCVISSPYQWENRTTLNSELGDKMYRNWMNEIECMMRLLGLDWSPPQTLAQAYSYHRTLWEMMCLSHCPGVPSAEQKYIEVTECADVEVSLNASGPQTASVETTNPSQTNQPTRDAQTPVASGPQTASIGGSTKVFQHSRGGGDRAPQESFAATGYASRADWAMHPPVRTDAAMMANTLIIGDSGMNYYHEDGGSMNLEKMLQERGFKNLTFVPVTGGGPHRVRQTAQGLHQGA